jgi:DNA-binding PadR family transcriptional regulator
MMEFAECPCTGKTLVRLLRPAILGILAKQPLHGYLILQRLEQMPMFKDPSPDTTGVYRTLKAMEDEGLLISKWNTAGNGPARRIFEITVDGKVCLKRWNKTLKRYQKDVDTLLKFLTKAV